MSPARVPYYGQLDAGEPRVGDGLRMDQMGELANAVGEARRRPREVRVAVDDHGPHRKAQVGRPLDRLVEAEPARRQHDQLRFLSENRLPCRREGVLTRL